MTTRSTIIEGKITGNSKEFTAETVRATNAAKRMQREAEKAAKAQQAAQQKLGQESTKAGNAIAGATSAIQAFGSSGDKSLTGLTRSLASVVALIGPQGALVAGATVASIALLEMLIKPRREVEALNAALDEMLRRLRLARDGKGLTSLAEQIGFGDRDLRLSDVGLDDIDAKSDAGKAAERALQEGTIKRARELREELAKLREEEERIRETRRKPGEGILTAAVDRGIRGSQVSARIEALEQEIAVVDRLEAARKEALSSGIRLQQIEQRKTDADKAARAAEEAKAKATREGAAAATQLGTALQTLEARLDAVAVKGDGPAALALQLDTLFEKVKKGGASTDVLEKLRSRIDALVKSASEAELENVGRALEDFVTESTLTLVDDLALAGQRATDSINDLIDTATNAGDFELASQLIDQRDAAVAANRALLDVTATLERLDAARKTATNASDANVIGLGGVNIGVVTAAMVEAAALRDIEQLLQNPDLSPKERKRLEEELAEITQKKFDAIQRNAKLEGEQASKQKLTLESAREYLNVLTAAASAIGGINSSLVRGLSGLSAIIGGLDDLTAAAKAAGGFSKLFTTGAGAIAGAGAVGAIVGGFSVIADTFDLFGNKARERARKMRDAAIEWGKALDDFVITTRSALDESLRQNLRRAEALFKQASEATGITPRNVTFNSADDLQKEIDYIDQVLSKIPYAGRAFASFRDELQKLLDGVLANEAELRRQNDERVAEATKDLEVRRLRSQGRTEEADALERVITFERELEAARADTSEAGKAYVIALESVIAAERAAAEAAIFRARVLSTLDTDLSINGLEGADALQAIIAAVGRLSPELAALTEGLDLDTAGGLSEFRTRLRDFYNTLAADGIDDLEAPIVALIQRLIGGIEGALSDLPEVVDPILAALEAFDVRARVFGLSISERIAGLAPLLAQQFGAIGEALGGIDLSSADGLGTFKDRLLGIVDGFLADGEIDAIERPIVDAIETILGLIGQSADEAAAAAEQAAADAESARATRVRSATAGADAAIALGDLDDADALQVRLQALAALSPALAELLTLDLTTLDGLDRAKGILRDVFAQIEDGSISAEMLGDLLGPELRDIILDLDGDFDGLIESVLAVGDAARDASAELQDFAAEVGRDFLRSAGMGLEAELAEIDDRIAKRIQKARSLGASDETIQQLLSIGQSERAAAIQRAADAAAREAEAAAKASQQGSTPTRSSQSVTTRSVQSITEVTGQVVAGYLRTIARDTQSIDTSLNTLLARGLGGAAPMITPPALPSAFAARSSSTTTGAGGMQVVIGDITVTVHGAVAGQSPAAIGQEIGRATLLQISSGLGRLAGLQDGGNRR